jgi:hypothetical protein
MQVNLSRRVKIELSDFDGILSSGNLKIQFHRKGREVRRASHQTKNRQTHTKRLINSAKQIVKEPALSLTSALDHSEVSHCIYIEICLELVRHEFESKGKRGKLSGGRLLLLVFVDP